MLSGRSCSSPRCWCRWACGWGRAAWSALLVGSVLMILVVELLNSALEAAVDRVSLDDHNLAKRAKDLGSAAVMVALACTAAVWFLVLLA